MIKLGGLVTLKPINEAEDDKYVSIGFGRFKEKGKEDDKDAPTFKKDGDKYVPTKGDTAAKGGDSSAGKEVPKVNIFNKDKEEPKSEPAKDSTGDRAGNPAVNMAVRKKAQKMGITPQKLGKEEYQKKMAQAAVAALTDANFHSEARQLVADLEGKPEMAEKPDYPKMDDPKYDEKMKVIRAKYDSVYSEPDDDAEDLGISAANEASWDGQDALDSIAFDLKMNGFKNLAAKLQSVIKESKSTRLKDLLDEGVPNLLNEGVPNLLKIMKSKYERQGYSLKQLHDEVIDFLGKKDGGLIFQTFIKNNESNKKLKDEFNKTSF